MFGGREQELKKLNSMYERDILAYRDRDAIFGECKWTNSLVDIDVLEDLIEQRNEGKQWIE
jgi:hypothetical protein